MVPDRAIAEVIADWAAAFDTAALPSGARNAVRRTLLDSLGLIVSARNEDYVKAVRNAADETGPCIVPGHPQPLDPMNAALLAGTSVHGEDFDDTFEGTPVHVGSVMVPAILAAAQQRGLSGDDVLRGIAIGGELMCRLTLVAPTAIHRQGFHPTAICGAFGAAAGIASALRLSPQQTASALGIVGSMASGIIEYLAEGTWTKRMHPGWAAGAGWRAARMAESGFAGPRTVFEGEHGALFAFAVEGIDRDFSQLTDGLGTEWQLANLAFKPYACGTMCQPYIDCALGVRDQVDSLDDIVAITAKVGEGTVHRLWQPAEEKSVPSTPYGAKFSGPFCIAVALVDGEAGLSQYTEGRIADPVVLAQAAKIRFDIDPNNEYPKNYTGDLIVSLADGRTLTANQPCLRGGRGAPMDDAELLRKFNANCAFGGWNDGTTAAFRSYIETLFEQPNLKGLRDFAQ